MKKIGFVAVVLVLLVVLSETSSNAQVIGGTNLRDLEVKEQGISMIQFIGEDILMYGPNHRDVVKGVNPGLVEIEFVKDIKGRQYLKILAISEADVGRKKIPVYLPIEFK